MKPSENQLATKKKDRNFYLVVFFLSISLFRACLCWGDTKNSTKLYVYQCVQYVRRYKISNWIHLINYEFPDKYEPCASRSTNTPTTLAALVWMKSLAVTAIICLLNFTKYMENFNIFQSSNIALLSFFVNIENFYLFTPFASSSTHSRSQAFVNSICSYNFHCNW